MVCSQNPGASSARQLIIIPGGIMKKILIVVVTFLAVLIAAAVIHLYPAYQWMVAVETVKMDPQLTVYLGGGGNTIVLTSPDGMRAIVVDSKMGSAAKKIKSLVKAPDVTIVNTHAHKDHAGSNSIFPNAKVIAGSYSKEQWDLESGEIRYPDETIKPGEEKIIKVEDETVHIRNMGRAHTTDDVVVYLEKRKMLVTGDLLFNKMHPAMLARSKCSSSLWVAVLDDLYKRYDVKTLVPGHGKITDKNAIIQMKDYFITISNAVDNPEKIKEVKEKFKDYFTLMFVSGFDKSVSFIRKEKKGEMGI